MFSKRFFSLAAALVCLAGLPLPIAAAEVDCDQVYCFSPGDFSQKKDLTGICITGLPDPEAGTVLLGSRVLREGDILTAGQVSAMTFAPASRETDAQAVISYLPIYADLVEAETAVAIQVLGKKDEAPVAEDSALETYKNLPNEAMLKVRDPEGARLTYTVIRQPKRGDVMIREDGSFVYTPRKNKVGVDSFTYTAADPAGNVSREATVTVTILKPTDAKQYTDTTGHSCRFAAEWMKNTGIFVGENVGGNGCFGPQKEVTRGEFLTMMTGALSVPVEEDFTLTGFTDEVPTWLQPYLAAAMRSGLLAGWPHGEVFGYDTPITGAEAAVILQNALDLAVISHEDSDAVPTWAASSLATLSGNGIDLAAEEVLTRGQAAEVLYLASRLAVTAPGTAVYR